MKKESLREHISEAVHDTLHIWKEEIKKTFCDTGMLIFFILVPAAYPLLYALIYNQESVREVPVVVVDNSKTTLSRQFIRMVDATADIQIVSYCTDLEEVQDAMRKDKAYGAILIPQEFSNEINRNIQTHVTIYCDMACLLYYKALLSSCTDVSLEMGNQIKFEKMNSYTQREEEVNARPFEYTYVALFNPQNGFASFLIPAVLILILQQTMLLGVGMSAGTDRERNNTHDLILVGGHNNGTLRIVFGKALAYFMIYCVTSAYVLCIVPYLFNLVQLTHFATLAAFIIPYIIACTFFAMTLSATIRNRETCILIFVFTSLPVLFISGISWPGASVPEYWKVVSWILPSTFGINGFVRINTMGATLSEVMYEFRALWMQAGLYFLTTCMVYYYQILISRGLSDKEIFRKMIGLKKKEST